jgi:AraC-like DNA-binding protein
MKRVSNHLERFSTRDCDEFADRIASVTPGRISVRSLRGPFEAEVTMAPLPRASIFSVRMEDGRVVQPEAVADCALAVPMADSLYFGTGHVRRRCAPGTAFVRSPGDGLDLRTPHRGPMLVIHLYAALLESLEAKLGHPLRSGETLPLATPAGRTFRRYLELVWDELQRGASFMRSPLATREIENTLGALFVAATSDDRQAAGATGPVPPGYLVRAEEYIRANLDGPLSVLDVAAAAGVSPRTLSGAFRKHRGVSTTGFVRMRRLEAVHQDLLLSPPCATRIVDVAMRYGFTHLGHFSSKYKRAFGEMPSDTLRR